jgi:DNA-binding NarL/FixJ family response regulator
MVEQNHPGSEKVRVLIVDGVRLVRDGLASLLLQSPDLAVVGFSPQETGYEEQQEGRAVDVVLAVAPWGVTALDEIQKIKDEFPGTKVVIIGVSGTEKEGLEYIEAGASGYILPESRPGYLIETIQQIHRGEASCPPDMLAHLFERIASLRAQIQVVQDSQLNSLTQRELEVLQLVADGMSNKEISAHLKLELQTVKNHVHSILEKLRVHNRREAVTYTHKFGLVVKSN